MSQHSIQTEIDAEKRRQSRIDQLLSTSTPPQITRYEKLQGKLEVALARNYGAKITPTVTARILEGLILEPEVLGHIGGATVDEMPKTVEGWNALAKKLVDAEPLAQLSIAHSDAERKEAYRNEELQKMNGAQRLAMSRAGNLDDHIEAKVMERINSDAGF